MSNTHEGIIAAYGATSTNVLNRGERGLISIVLHRTDAGYATTSTVMGSETADMTNTRYFVNLDEARALFESAVAGLRIARARESR